MKAKLICIGKTKVDWVNKGIQHYQKRIRTMASLEVSYLKDSKQASPDLKKKQEAKIILNAISDDDYLVVLDESGEEMDSVSFAQWLDHPSMVNQRRAVFVIGGAYGFDQGVTERANKKLSLSQMTFPHDLVRVLFLEQYYRALSIIHHKNYHHV